LAGGVEWIQLAQDRDQWQALVLITELTYCSTAPSFLCLNFTVSWVDCCRLELFERNKITSVDLHFVNLLSSTSKTILYIQIIHRNSSKWYFRFSWWQEWRWQPFEVLVHTALG
jgi:hypothetical protein